MLELVELVGLGLLKKKHNKKKLYFVLYN